MSEKFLKARIFAIDRHRIDTDGQGVTTLVCFNGCRLLCEYCINPECWHFDSNVQVVTPEELLDIVKIDNLYFSATGGGITFGGGEPALQSEFIEAFCKIAPAEWHFNIETSLFVFHQHLERLLPYIDKYFIDIKDVNPKIYEQYTHHDNHLVLNNLRWLLSHEGMAERIIVRLPLIKDFNTPDDVRRSREYLESIGVTQFDEFEYQCDHRLRDSLRTEYCLMGYPTVKSSFIQSEKESMGWHVKSVFKDLCMILQILFCLWLIYYAISKILSCF